MFHKTIIATLVLTAIATVLFSVKVAECQEYLTSGLIGFWTMDEEDIQGDTVKDVSGNGHDGTIQGDPKPIKGKLEEALHFDGNMIMRNSFGIRMTLETLNLSFEVEFSSEIQELPLTI